MYEESGKVLLRPSGVFKARQQLDTLGDGSPGGVPATGTFEELAIHGRFVDDAFCAAVLPQLTQRGQRVRAILVGWRALRYLPRADPRFGDLLWEYRAGCNGGYGGTPVVNQGRVWVREQSGDVVLDAATGERTGTFTAGPIPAFDDTTGYFLNGTVLSARSATTGTPWWTFSGDGQLVTAPITANGSVQVGSATGNVYALHASTGELLTTVNVGAAIPTPNETVLGYPLAGMAVGLGHLVVPADSKLTVYGSH